MPAAGDATSLPAPDAPRADQPLDGAVRSAPDGQQRAVEPAADVATRLRALEAVTDVALAPLPLDALLQALLGRITTVMGIDNAAILLLDAAGTMLHVRAARGLEEEVAAGVRVPFGQGFAGTVAARRAPYIVDDLSKISVASRFLQEKLHSVVGVPLMVEDRVIGVVHVGTVEPRLFTMDDARLLQLVADRAAQAIERARLYEVLEDRERRYRAIFEQAAVGMARVGMDGRWLEVNARLCAITGHTREELLALTFQDITHPDDLEGDLALVEQMLAGEIPSYSLEKRYLRRDGSAIWINLTVSLVRDAENEPAYFISIIEDIDARKRAQAALRELTATLEQRVAVRTAQLSEANGELEAFAYSVSHDLRAPLRAMQGFSQALTEDYGEELDETARLYCARISAAAGRMEQLIQDLLAYSRLSRAEIARQPVSLRRALDEALAMLGAELRADGATIAVEEPLPSVLGHLPTLTQVIANLLTNAVKFVAPGVAPRVRVWATRRGGHVRLWVADNGIGIAPEHQERIFRVFERLHGVEQYPGTGIGLAIVRKGLERMGGASGVEAIPGEGSRFWIELPAAPEERIEEGGAHADGGL